MSPAHLPTCPLAHLPTYPLTHLPTCPLTHQVRAEKPNAKIAFISADGYLESTTSTSSNVAEVKEQPNLHVENLEAQLKIARARAEAGERWMYCAVHVTWYMKLPKSDVKLST